MDGSIVFSRWCQWQIRLNLCLLWPKWQIYQFSHFCTAECHRIYWRHLVNTIELLLPSAHQSPQTKQQIDRFSRFCTAHGKKSLDYNRQPFPKKLPLPARDVDPHLTDDFLGQYKPTIQTASWSVQLFSHRWLQTVPILYHGMSLSPIKIAPSHGGSGPPSNTWFPGPTQVLNPNGISIGSAVFAGLTSVTDWPTDRPC